LHLCISLIARHIHPLHIFPLGFSFLDLDLKNHNHHHTNTTTIAATTPPQQTPFFGVPPCNLNVSDSFRLYFQIQQFLFLRVVVPTLDWFRSEWFFPRWDRPQRPSAATAARRPPPPAAAAAVGQRLVGLYLVAGRVMLPLSPKGVDSEPRSSHFFSIFLDCLDCLSPTYSTLAAVRGFAV